MIATRMIPAMWIRLVVIIAFGIFMSVQSQTIFVVISIGLAGLTGAQLIYAYRQKGSDHAK